MLFSISSSGSNRRQAMNLLHRQSTDFRSLWSSIAGAIFLGTPHNQSSDPSSWHNAGAILRLHSKSKNIKIPPTEDVAGRLAKISLSFEQAFDLIPVFSAYESRQTRIGSFLSSKSIVSRTMTCFRAILFVKFQFPAF